MSDATTFVHLTDLHLVPPGGSADHPCAGNADRLRKAVSMIGAIRPLPDFIALSGDIADRGDIDSYRLAREVLGESGLPVVHALGNHDTRQRFYAGMLDRERDLEAPYCHDHVFGDAHVIALDTSVAGKVAGALCQPQFAFLGEALARHPRRTKVIVMHHAPWIGQGIGHGWETIGPQDSESLADAIHGHKVAGILTGHVHYDRVSIWNGVPVVTTTGLYNANDILHNDGLRFVAGASFALCTLRDGALTVAYVPLPSDRRELAVIDEETVRSFV
ncbi:phosphodiesterase [Nitratireductor mangrovi]|uniref:Phosphodiesterase n=1 Tax=Nitratireductor mangrovi TaxID=2599600 RepID=A0A5B8KTY5_9HYPH|nr:metallophosphoesterase [Nitratireductor mangrovi]QDY99038.1 phosphodiesterase [Nitratireductor mangrovi]